MKEVIKKILPRWNLTNLYGGKPEALKGEMEKIQKSCSEFTEKYENLDLCQNVSDLLQALEKFEQIAIHARHVTLFASLLYFRDLSNNGARELYQSTSEHITRMMQGIVFFQHRVAHLPENFVKKNKKFLNKYHRWIELERRVMPHLLDVATEKILLEKDLVADQAWVDFYDKLFNDIKIQYRKRTLSYDMAREKLTSVSRTTRRQVAKRMNRAIVSLRLPLFEIMNSVLMNKGMEDRFRKYENPVSSRNIHNDIQNEDLEILVKTVRENYHVAHRYYALKAKILGLKKLQYYDLSAPIPLSKKFTIAWPRAREIIMDAYGNFSPRLAHICEEFFQNNWIDAQVRQHKAGGAFCCPGTTQVNPYISLMYHSDVDSVMTLAHELGHGIHFILSGKQNYLLQDAPLTLCETASVFGEMITFDHLLSTARDTELYRYLLAMQIEDKLATMVRQIAFHIFELSIHTKRSRQYLSHDDIGEIWKNTQEESLGDAVELAPEYRHHWASIPHFVRYPFYVYSYAFGNCLVTNLYSLYQSCQSHDQRREEFVHRYIQMLEAGNGKNYRDLLSTFGLDPRRRDFWQNGINFISGLVDKLEKII